MTETIETDAGPVAAVAIGKASSRRAGSERWNEVTIYRATDGSYIVTDFGETAVPHETRRGRTFVAATPETVVHGLLRGKKRLSDVAQEAIDAACAADPVFARDSSEASAVQLYGSAEPQPGSLVYTLPRRRDALSLRFCGRLLALESSKQLGREAWGEVAIFAADAGGFVVDVHRAELVDSQMVRVDDDASRVLVVPTAIDAMDALLISGGLNTSSWTALVRAAAGDVVFAAQLGDRHRRAFARFTIPELRIGTGIRHRRVSGIAIGRNAADTGNALLVRVLRIAPRKGASEATYLFVRTLGTRTANPQRASTVEELSREQLIERIDTTESRALFVQCVGRDLDIARAARAASKWVATPEAANAEPTGDVLDATLPRDDPAEMPPMWD